MFAVVLIIIQFLILIFIGGFARTSQALNSPSYYIGTNILFLLSWTLMCTPLKKLTLSTLSILILTFAFTFECDLLFGRFWYNVFNQFTTSYELTIDIFVQCSISVFAVLLVMLDYIGIFRHWQIYMLLVPVINILWSLNYAILRYGLKMFDGGCGMTVFLFAGVVSILIWIISVRQKHQKFGGYDVKNGNHLMRSDIYIRDISLYGGLIGTFILWPSVNSSTSISSSTITTLNPSILNNIVFQNTAYFNTMLALAVGTICSFLLVNRDGTRERKQRIRCTIDCFINSGIICASFMDISLNPAASMAMALIATTITLILYLYYQSIEMEPNKMQNLSNFMIVVMHFSRPLFRIILPLLGSIVAAIVVANRQASTIQLLDTTTYGTDIYSKTAGLQIGAYFITFVIAIVTGVLCGLAINLFLYFKNNEHLKQETGVKVRQSNIKKSQVNELDTPQKVRKLSDGQLRKYEISIPIPKQSTLNDLNFLQIQQESQQIFPLFLQRQDAYIDEQQTARKMLKQAILSHVKSNYASMNNYISVNKNKNANVNVNTNNTFGDAKDNVTNNPRKKLEFGIDEDFVLRNNAHKSSHYVNNMHDLTPKSGNSQIKNQTKEIVDLVNKDRSLMRQKSYQREAMPSFYIDHMIKNQNSSNIQPLPNNRMNRSKTETNIVYNSNKPTQINDGNKVNNRKSILSSGINVVSKYPQHRESQIKKTKSETFINQGLGTQYRGSKLELSDIKAISEMEREQEEYKSRNVNVNEIKRKQTNISRQTLQFMKINQANLESNRDIRDDGSEIMDENQNEEIVNHQDSQVI